MTPQRAKELLPVITAFANGEQVEYRTSIGEWESPDAGSVLFCDNLDYRIKPKPVTRPWCCANDVPAPICWVRQTPTDRAKLITEVSDDGVMFGYGGTGASWIWFTNYPAQYSTDRKTWLPCTVTEESK